MGPPSLMAVCGLPAFSLPAGVENGAGFPAPLLEPPKKKHPPNPPPKTHTPPPPPFFCFVRRTASRRLPLGPQQANPYPAIDWRCPLPGPERMPGVVFLASLPCHFSRSGIVRSPRIFLFFVRASKRDTPFQVHLRDQSSRQVASSFPLRASREWVRKWWSPLFFPPTLPSETIRSR